jgi:hypothetical protein
MKVRENLGELEKMRRKKLKLILKKCGTKMWTGFIWLRTGSRGKLS